MKNLLLFGLITLTINTLGCSYAMEEVGLFKVTDAKLPEINILQKFADRPIDFEIVKATSLKNCLECHSAGGRAMNTPEKVIAQQDDIMMAINLDTMPPKASGLRLMNLCEKKILETWLEDQAQGRIEVQKVGDIAACSGVEPEAEKSVDLKTLELSFENLKAHVFAKKCMTCHTVEKAKKTILEDLAQIEKRELIKGTAEDSILYQIVVPGLYKRFMPPAKSGIPALNADEVDYLKRWINDRASQKGFNL